MKLPLFVIHIFPNLFYTVFFLPFLIVYWIKLSNFNNRIIQFTGDQLLI